MPLCWLSSQRNDCTCQMEGFGAYFAERKKALYYANLARVEVPGTNDYEGGLLECEVQWLTSPCTFRSQRSVI
jgi:hypothetical protein